LALSGVPKEYRRALIVAAGGAGVALVVSAIMGHLLVGAFLAVGLALGFVNTRLVVGAAARFAASESRDKRPLIVGALRRLALVTAAALVLAVAFRPAGLAVLIGLAVFQLLLVGNTSTSLYREVRGVKS
jgi:hypothetical protein